MEEHRKIPNSGPIVKIFLKIFKIAVLSAKQNQKINDYLKNL
jgi:hypothetical protein